MHALRRRFEALQLMLACLFGSSIDREKQFKALEKEVTELRNENAVLREMAHHDPLTSLKNRRGFNAVSTQVHALAVRTGKSFCVCLIDIDHFKHINDTHGHDVGDVVLRKEANMLLKLARGSDCVARYGGEEFIILLPETSVTQAGRYVERLRSHLERNTIAISGGSISVTVSIGLAEWERGDDLKTLIAGADQALYQAKRAGRNRVCVHKKG